MHSKNLQQHSQISHLEKNRCEVSVYKVFEVFVYKVFIDVKYLYKKYSHIIRLTGGKTTRVGTNFRKKMGVSKSTKPNILVRNRCTCETKLCGLYKKLDYYRYLLPIHCILIPTFLIYLCDSSKINQIKWSICSLTSGYRSMRFFDWAIWQPLACHSYYTISSLFYYFYGSVTYQ